MNQNCHSVLKLHSQVGTKSAEWRLGLDQCHVWHLINMYKQITINSRLLNLQHQNEIAAHVPARLDEWYCKCQVNIGAALWLHIGVLAWLVADRTTDLSSLPASDYCHK